MVWILCIIFIIAEHLVCYQFLGGWEETQLLDQGASLKRQQADIYYFTLNLMQCTQMWLYNYNQSVSVELLVLEQTELFVTTLTLGNRVSVDRGRLIWGSGLWFKWSIMKRQPPGMGRAAHATHGPQGSPGRAVALQKGTSPQRELLWRAWLLAINHQLFLAERWACKEPWGLFFFFNSLAGLSILSPYGRIDTKRGILEEVGAQWYE